MTRALYWVAATVPRILVTSAVLLTLFLGGRLAAKPGWVQTVATLGFWVTVVPLWTIALRVRLPGDRIRR